MRVSAFGEDDLQTADSYNNIGNVQTKLGRYEEAMVNLKKTWRYESGCWVMETLQSPSH